MRNDCRAEAYGSARGLQPVNGAQDTSPRAVCAQVVPHAHAAATVLDARLTLLARDHMAGYLYSVSPLAYSLLALQNWLLSRVW